MSVAGQDNTVGGPIHLPLVDEGSSKIVGGDQDVTLTMADVPGFSLTVFANSATFHGGSRTGRLSVSQVHFDKVPMPPPNGSPFTVAWTLQPPGVHFHPPARLTVPNTGFPPGQLLDMFWFDHDLGMFVPIGGGSVSADGSVIESDPGFGVGKTGWGGFTPPPPPTTCVSGCGRCNICDRGACVPGHEGEACDDGDPCSAASVCRDGLCFPTAGGGTCDDGDSCTVDDKCLAGICVGTLVLEGPCDDNRFCTTGDHCDAGECTGTQVPERVMPTVSVSLKLSSIFSGVRRFLTRLGLTEKFDLEATVTEAPRTVCCEAKKSDVENYTAQWEGALEVRTDPIPTGLNLPLPPQIARLGFFVQLGSSVSFTAEGAFEGCTESTTWSGGGTLDGTLSLQGRADATHFVEVNVAGTVGVSGRLDVANGAVVLKGGHRGVTISGSVVFFDMGSFKVMHDLAPPDPDAFTSAPFRLAI